MAHGSGSNVSGPLVPLVWYFDHVARWEEDDLPAKFGDEFAQYADDGRRWL